MTTTGENWVTLDRNEHRTGRVPALGSVISGRSGLPGRLSAAPGGALLALTLRSLGATGIGGPDGRARRLQERHADDPDHLQTEAEPWACAVSFQTDMLPQAHSLLDGHPC